MLMGVFDGYGGIKIHIAIAPPAPEGRPAGFWIRREGVKDNIFNPLGVLTRPAPVEVIAVGRNLFFVLSPSFFVL